MASANRLGRRQCARDFVPHYGWLGTVAALTILFLARPLALAAPADAFRARKAVQGWLRMDGRPLQAALGASVVRVDTFPDAQGLPAYHIVYLDPDGFVIVPADDDVEPIVGFVGSGSFDPSPDNPLGALVSRDLPGRLQAARRPQEQQAIRARDHGNASKWQRFLLAADGIAMYSIAGIGGISDVRVSPLIASRWSQGNEGASPCYNYYTPNNYPSGCVATAMAQLMRYHQHPVTGIGQRDYTITVNGAIQPVQTRGGDGAGGPYNWSAMVLDPSSTTTDVERQAIGALCYDAGLSVSMSYASGSSGAYNLGESALTATFGYSNAIRAYNGAGLAVANLYPLINPNLDADFPVLLGISGTVGGHSVVVDGYGYSSATPYHHLNMGWGSYQDAWYNLPTVDSSPGPFTTVFECGYNIYVTGAGEIISGRVLDPAGLPIVGATVTAQRSGGSVYTATTNANGIYALAKVPSSASYTISVSDPIWGFAPQAITTGNSSSSPAVSGNRWGVDFTGQPATPPTATAGTVNTRMAQPVTITLQASDDGRPAPATLRYVIVSLPAHGQLSDPGGGSISGVPFALAGNGSQVRYSPAMGYAGPDSFTFKANDGGVAPAGGDSNVATVSIAVRSLVYATYMDTDPDWTLNTGWAWGRPTGGGSSNADPASGNTGQNVVGYNLAGDYANNLTARYATTSAIDCTGYYHVALAFSRWLGVGASPGDNAAIQVSSNGTSWTSVWANGATDILDTSWQSLEYDISAVADNQRTVYIRWVMGTTGSKGTYPGWNIDDVEIVADYLLPAVPASPSPVDAQAGMAADAVLSWNGGQAAPGVTYDVYLDTANPPVAQVGANLAAAACNPGPLADGMTYYWKVLARNAYGSVSGSVWSFHVAARLAGDIDANGHVDATDLLYLADSWGRRFGEPGYDSRCDLNSDGVVDLVDLLMLADNWGT